jgi:ribosomal protein S4
MRNNVHVETWLQSVGAVPSYLAMDRNNYSATLVRIPEQKEIPVPVQMQLIVEFYNRLT